AVMTERRVLAATGGSCRAPVGAVASVSGGRLSLLAAAAAPDGSKRCVLNLEAEATEPGGLRIAEQAGRGLVQAVVTLVGWEHARGEPGKGTGAAGRPGFAGPNELVHTTPKRRPQGGGTEGEPWFPLHQKGTGGAGRPGFAGPNELVHATPKQRPQGGGTEGEPWFPLHQRG